MNATSTLPDEPPQTFAGLAPGELLQRLVEEEDRAPLELIEACVAHDDAMVVALRDVIEGERSWYGDTSGAWWLLLHAAFILGRIPSEAAGTLLVQLMRRMEEEDDEDLQDWLAGHWPALFANKPQAAIDAACALAVDASLDWYIRAQAMEVTLDAGFRAGGAALEDALDRAVALAHDESDEWLMRINTAATLLDLPRARHRAWLEEMGAEDQRREAELGSSACAFSEADVASAFARNRDEPDWLRFGDPWGFYSPDQIAARQQRWREEAERQTARESDPDWNESDLDWDAPCRDRDTPLPYVRFAPKVGRNDPCPCGSGRKYKRCCLARHEAVARNVRGQV